MELSDFSGLLLELVFSILSALVSYLVFRINTWIGLKKDNEIRTYLEAALQKALDYGKIKAKSKIEETISHLDVKDEILEYAIGYAANAIPDALLHFKITPDKLKTMLSARLTDD